MVTDPQYAVTAQRALIHFRLEGELESPLADWPHGRAELAPCTSPAPAEPDHPAPDAVARARDASELLHAFGIHSPYLDGVALSAIDEATVLAVGYQPRRRDPDMATGRVAWIRRDTWADGWTQERRMPGEGLSVGVGTKGVEYRLSVSVKLPDLDALLDLVAWLRGDE